METHRFGSQDMVQLLVEQLGVEWSEAEQLLTNIDLQVQRRRHTEAGQLTYVGKLWSDDDGASRQRQATELVTDFIRRFLW